MPRPGAAYTPVGHLITHLLYTAIDAQDVFTLNVLAEGVWVSQFSAAQLASLRSLVVGKNQQKSQSLLLQQRCKLRDEKGMLPKDMIQCSE